MKRTDFIRLGGLAAMVGGGAWVASGTSSFWLSPPILILFVVGVMAAIAALYALQRERYGLRFLVTLASLMAFVGVALLGGMLYMGSSLFPVGGLLLATVGLFALAMVTIAAKVMPWWVGVALIAGSPPFVFLWVFPWLLGVPWVVVGYAVFRAGTRQTQQPSRVR
jgi:hypothetical protein